MPLSIEQTIYTPNEADRDRFLAEFVAWVGSAPGADIGRVAIGRSGRGFGLFARDDIKIRERILEIPSSLFITPQDEAVASLFAPSSNAGTSNSYSESGYDGVNGTAKLATYLLLRPDADLAWRRTWPTTAALRADLPFFWSAPAQALLPPSARMKLEPQIATVRRQWQLARDACAQLGPADEPDFYYFYFLVGTRTMYWAGGAGAAQVPHADRLALVPFLDLCNHESDREPAEPVPAGYRLSTTFATEPVPAGDELFVSYGAHDNDFLIVEYGFALHDSSTDLIELDYLLDGLASPEDTAVLARNGYWPDFFLMPGPVPELCFRMQVALYFLADGGDTDKWRDFKNGTCRFQPNVFPPPPPPAGSDRPDVIVLFVDRLAELIRTGSAIVEPIDNGHPSMNFLSPDQASVISTRWADVIKYTEKLKNMMER